MFFRFKYYNFEKKLIVMETLLVTVKSETAAQALKEFLGTISYVDGVQASASLTYPPFVLVKGEYKSDEKPSDFAGIWRKRKKKLDAKKLRKQAWTRKK